MRQGQAGLAAGRGGQSRARILEHVLKQPGIHKTQLCRDLGVHWGTLEYHLGVLEEHDCIRIIRYGRRAHAFPTSVPAPYMVLTAALNTPGDAEILQALHDGEAATSNALARRTGATARTVQRRLERLLATGLIRLLGDSRPRFSIEPKVQEHLDLLQPLCTSEELHCHGPEAPGRPVQATDLHDGAPPTRGEQESTGGTAHRNQADRKTPRLRAR